MLVSSAGLPVASQVVRASPTEPFLGLKLELNPAKIAELTLKVYPHGPPPARESRSVYLDRSDAGIVGAAIRLLELVDDPRNAELLAPLVIEELLLRLLRSSSGGRLAQVGLADSHVYRIAEAVDWLRINFDQTFRVEALAEMVHMSPPSFHQHFKVITGRSHLQFQ